MSANKPPPKRPVAAKKTARMDLAKLLDPAPSVGQEFEMIRPVDPVPSRPFKARITGELRSRLFHYARNEGRSANGAICWLLHQALKEKGY